MVDFLARARKAVVNFLSWLVATVASVVATIQADAPQVTTTATAIIGAVGTIASTLLVYLTPNDPKPEPPA